MSQPLSLHLLLVISISRLVLLMNASRKKAEECLTHFNVFSFPLMCRSSLDLQYLTSHPCETTEGLLSSLTLHSYFLLSFLTSPAHCLPFSKCIKRKRTQNFLTHLNRFPFPHILAALVAL